MFALRRRWRWLLLSLACYVIVLVANHGGLEPTSRPNQQYAFRQIEDDGAAEEEADHHQLHHQPSCASNAFSPLVKMVVAHQGSSPGCSFACGSCVDFQLDDPQRKRVLCAPRFIIIGAAKAGTSSLYHWLTAHPNIRAADKKELHFWTFRFSLKSSKVERYLGNFSSAARHYANRSTTTTTTTCARTNGESAIITGEATPDMHYYPLAPYRLQHMLPDVKIIFLVRPPFELAWSMFHFNRGKMESGKNVKRFSALAPLRRSLNGAEYAEPILELLIDNNKSMTVPNEGRHGRSSNNAVDAAAAAKALFSSFTFDSWMVLFAFEIEACLVCLQQDQRGRRARGLLEISSGNSTSAQCSKLPQLNARAPTLYRWHEDVRHHGGVVGGQQQQPQQPQQPRKAEDILSLGGRLNRKDQCWFPPTTHHLNFFGRTAYDRQVRLYQAFRFRIGEQLQVVESKALFDDPQTGLGRLVQFLGLPPFEFTEATLGVRLQGPLRHGDFAPPAAKATMKATAKATTRIIRQARKPTDHTSATTAQRIQFEALQRRLDAIAENRAPTPLP